MVHTVLKRDKDEVKKTRKQKQAWLLPERLIGKMFSFAGPFCPKMPFSLLHKNMDILTETQCIK